MGKQSIQETITDLEELCFYTKFIPNDRVKCYRKKLKKMIKKLKKEYNEELSNE